MRHQQYRESLLERLRLFILRNPDASLAMARSELRPALTAGDIDLLFDNWLNANFDRIEVKRIGPKSISATIRPLRQTRRMSADERAEHKRRQDHIAARVARDAKENLFQEFASRIWDTALPNGVLLRQARGRDLKVASGWLAAVARMVKPSESVFRKLTTRDLFNVAQRVGAI